MRAELERFLAHLAEERGYSPNTVRAYGSDLEEFLATLDDPLSVRPAEVRSYIGNLVLAGARKSTVARKLAAIRSFWCL